MESLLEQQRKAHEEIERVEQVIVNEYRNAPKNHKERVSQEHCIHENINRISERSNFLLQLYEDADGVRKEEIDALSGPNEFSEFYKRLKIIKDYHRRYPNEAAEPMDLEFTSLEDRRDEVIEELETSFTGEESFGRFLDLNAIYDQYINLKQFERIDYISYVNEFDKFHEIPKEKKNAEYRKYLESLLDYLEGFLHRVKPLTDLSFVYAELEKKFEEDWMLKKMNAEDDKSLYCIPCCKQFAKQTVFDAHLTGKKHLNAAAKLTLEPKFSKMVQEKQLKGDEKEKSLAFIEYKITKLAEILGEERENTKANVERKQSRTTEEREEDIENENEVVSSDSEDEDKVIYNPLNLPLGWDGKPIPYWLYKLHGLGVEYKCEICGNYTYMGRKPFERHFSEWRHAYGMRCLGIPNTKHFMEVTTMEGAKALWAKLQKDREKGAFRADQEEEYEDDRGNVFNKKTYDDLKRQGIL